jgi:hypothetical protein
LSKTPSAKEDEDYKGRIRELEKENRSLRRRLKKLERNRQIWEQFSLDADENVPIEPDQYKVTPTCPQQPCKGDLILLDLGVKKLWSCTTCGYRRIHT